MFPASDETITEEGENVDDFEVGQFSVQHDTAPAIPKLEQTLQEVKCFYQEAHRENVDDVKLGRFIVQRKQPTMPRAPVVKIVSP